MWSCSHKRGGGCPKRKPAPGALALWGHCRGPCRGVKDLPWSAKPLNKEGGQQWTEHAAVSDATSEGGWCIWDRPTPAAKRSSKRSRRPSRIYRSRGFEKI